MKISEAEFPSPPQQSLYCPICQEIFQDPLIIRSCSHTFCASCIYQSLEREYKCPMCRSTCSASVKSIIDELIVCCPYKKSGCMKLFPLDKMTQHISNCEYKPSNCPHYTFGCSFTGSSNRIPLHLQTCAYESLKEYIKASSERLNLLEEKFSRQARELERLREFVRTSKTNPSISTPSTPKLQAKHLEISPVAEDQVKWTDHSFTCAHTIRSHSCGVTSLALDSQFIYSGAYDGSIKVFDFTSTDYDIIKTWSAHANTVWSIAVDGKRLFTGGSDSKIKMWDIGNNEDVKCLSSIDEHHGKIYSLLHGHLKLFSASSDKSVKIWHSENLVVEATLLGHTDNVNGLSLADLHLISGSSDKSVKLWDISTQTCLQTLSSGIYSEVLDVSYGENLVFASTYDATIQVWDIRAPTSVKASLVGHNWEVWQVEYVEGMLFSASFDHSIRKWDLRTMSCLEILSGHQGYVHALKVGPEMLVSACADKTIKIWS